MELFNLSPATIFSFLLSFFRISLIVFLLPFFGGRSIPVAVKAALCVVLTLALWPHLSFPGVLFPANPWMILLMLAGELVLGLTLGLIVYIMFAAIQTGGEIIGFQMGFAMVNVVDPMTGTSEAVTAHFLYMVSLLVFLSLDGHLLLLQGLGHSFKLVEPGGLFISPELGTRVIEFSSQLFLLAVKIAAPVMAALFLVDLALALIGRAAPQMHILMLGFPLKIAVGFFFLGLLFTVMASYIQDFILNLGPMYHGILNAAHH